MNRTALDSVGPRLDDAVLDADDVRGDELILCHSDGDPAALDGWGCTPGRSLIITWSGDRSDADIMGDIAMLRVGGWPLDNPRVLHADPAMLRYVCGEPDIVVLRDPALSAPSVIVDVEVDA